MNRCEAPFQQGGTAVSAVIGRSVESCPNENPLRAIRFAVVVCSNQRTPGAKRAIESVLSACPKPDLIVIVDQAADATPDLLRVFDGLPGVIRIRDKGKGLSRARNIGTTAAEEAGATVVAYTDDDCTVEADWLAGFASAFGMADDVALVFGTTKAAPHDTEEGTIPAYGVPRNTIHRGVVAKPDIEGMGACMALRIDAWRWVGGFDERLGAGTPLASAEENDLSLRLLCAGFAVAETPASEVVHHGFRDRSAAPVLVAGYMRGSGAATAKMVRLGGAPAILACAAIGKRWLSGRSGIKIDHLPPRWIRLASFLEGMIAGFKMEIDPATGRFLPFESSHFIAGKASGETS